MTQPLRSVTASSLTAAVDVYEAEVGDAAIDYAVVASVDEAKVDSVDPRPVVDRVAKEKAPDPDRYPPPARGTETWT